MLSLALHFPGPPHLYVVFHEYKNFRPSKKNGTSFIQSRVNTDTQDRQTHITEKGGRVPLVLGDPTWSPTVHAEPPYINCLRDTFHNITNVSLKAKDWLGQVCQSFSIFSTRMTYLNHPTPVTSTTLTTSQHLANADAQPSAHCVSHCVLHFGRRQCYMWTH